MDGITNAVSTENLIKRRRIRRLLQQNDLNSTEEFVRELKNEDTVDKSKKKFTEVEKKLNK